MLLRRGQVCRPGENGPSPALAPSGAPLDPFDVIDRIVRNYSLLYLVDLDGIERTEPQLDYIQEFSRDIALWVDGGVRDADQSIDILVAGAQRAVVSSAMLEGPEELERAWGLTTELAFEIAIEDGALRARSEWNPTSPLGLAKTVREIGVGHLIVSPRNAPVDWPLIRSLAAGGPTWVDGSFEASEARHLSDVGAAGGIFHINSILDEEPAPPP
jgi:Histidine biosynthesis protein